MNNPIDGEIHVSTMAESNRHCSHLMLCAPEESLLPDPEQESSLHAVYILCA